MTSRSKKSNFKHYAWRIAIALFLVIPVFFFSIYIGFWGEIPDKKELSNFEYQQASEVYAADSTLIGKFYVYDRQPIAYQEFPKHLIDALIAIEDERFYNHSGVDYPSLFRVSLKTILMGDKSAGGGSTLTQQLAKNLYPRNERNHVPLIVDKIKEMIIARRLEESYTKKEILTFYLNTVSFGDNTFGIESASLKFFNKKTIQLSIEEAATLIGMLKATYSYNPRVFPEASLRRRNLVLQSMHANKFLSDTEKDSLTLTPLVLNYTHFDNNAGVAPYFREEVRKQLLQWASDKKQTGETYNIYTSGLKIYTTLNYKMQLLAEEAMRAHMKGLQGSFEKSYGKSAPWLVNKALIKKVTEQSETYKKFQKSGFTKSQIQDTLLKKREMVLGDWEGKHTVQASTLDSLLHYLKQLNVGSLSIDPHTGAVQTWIGGIDFKNFKYDHISQSKRQVGSTFKPFVYTAALENGIDPCSYFSAREVAYEDLEGWTPGNSGNTDEAYLNYSMKEALSKSINTVTVKVLEKTGIQNVIGQAKKMGIVSELPNLPSIALGTGELSINELAGAYASYLNKGKSVTPFLIQRITDNKDSVLEVFAPIIAEKPAFSEGTRQLILEMLKETANSGTASRLRHHYQLKNDIAGKTGTTQNNKDAWFVGLTPNLVHISWVGLEHHEIGFNSTSLGQGANAALPLFAILLQKMNKDPYFNPFTKAKFDAPTSVVKRQLDCEPIKRDGFLKRLFTNPNKPKSKKFKTKQ